MGCEQRGCFQSGTGASPVPLRGATPRCALGESRGGGFTKAGPGVLYNAAFAFPEGATLTVENFTPPAADEKTFTLLRFGGAVVNPPQATLPGGAQPTDPWEFKWRGNRLCCRNKCGCVLILR